jgi:hypothetical protein
VARLCVLEQIVKRVSRAAPAKRAKMDSIRTVRTFAQRQPVEPTAWHAPVPQNVVAAIQAITESAKRESRTVLSMPPPQLAPPVLRDMVEYLCLAQLLLIPRVSVAARRHHPPLGLKQVAPVVPLLPQVPSHARVAAIHMFSMVPPASVVKH